MRLAFLLFLFSTNWLFAQKPAVYDSFEQLEKRLLAGGDTVFIVNFWATWCVPCVEELPYFEELTQKLAGQKAKVLLVSIDFKSQIDKRVVPFLQARSMASEVVLLADQDANTWIPKVDPKWDGAIPATWLVRGDKRAFHREKFPDFKSLQWFVQPFLKF